MKNLWFEWLSGEKLMDNRTSASFTQLAADFGFLDEAFREQLAEDIREAVRRPSPGSCGFDHFLTQRAHLDVAGFFRKAIWFRNYYGDHVPGCRKCRFAVWCVESEPALVARFLSQLKGGGR